MDERTRKRQLEDFLKQAKQGNFDTRSFVSNRGTTLQQALGARDLMSDAMAHEYLKNSASVPSSKKRYEDFITGALKGVYGDEIDFNLKVSDDLENLVGAKGIWSGDEKLLGLNNSGNLRDMLGTAFHEGGHAYEEQKLKYEMPYKLSRANTQLNDKDAIIAHARAQVRRQPIDPTNLYEVAAKGHHARIPVVRDADSFEKGALKSLLENGRWKSVAGALPLAGTAMALSSGDANAAMEELPGEVPVVGQAYEAIKPTAAGDAFDDRQMQKESEAFANYGKSQARMDALKARMK